VVDVEGNLRPFRIELDDFIHLVSHISAKFNDVSNPIKRIDITVTRFRKNCANVDEMVAFLKGVHMPKVVKDLTLWIRAQTDLTVYFHFSSEYARYSIGDAIDMNQAKLLEDTITEFFKKHTTSRLFSPFVGIFLAPILLFVPIIEAVLVTSPLTHGSVLAYRPFVLLTGICAVVLSVYVAWSALTAEPPPISFVHSIVYIDKPPNRAIWILISAILFGVVISAISNWIG
jgi:hypothetical protein